MPRGKKTGRLGQKVQARRKRHHNTGSRANQKRRPLKLSEELAKKVKR